MRLRALHLENVRRFAGQRASIRGIGDGVTVVSEANEFGKSTFFDALHALFFERHGSTGKGVRSLQPYAGGAVTIAAEVETEAGIFRLEKRFLSRKAASVTRLADGGIIARDDEAERWIGALLGAEGAGPAGLLWVRQGQLGLEADAASERERQRETRRDLLSSVAGEIEAMTGGRRMDRVLRRVDDALAPLTTPTGRPSGAWRAAQVELETLAANLEDLSARLSRLETALEDRRAAQTERSRLDDPEAAARRQAALVAAASALEAGQAHAGA
ncbi:MAG: AAA family ATPase, partial [Rhodobacteraceae bacterium]|nr:AAA family ATPase [Paracoccaceae bacterium]